MHKRICVSFQTGVVNGVSKLKKMSKCYREVHVPVPQEINPSNRDKKKVKALESFKKNSHVKKTYLLILI